MSLDKVLAKLNLCTHQLRKDRIGFFGVIDERFDVELEDRRGKPPTDDLLSRMVHSEAMGHLEPMERIANIAFPIRHHRPPEIPYQQLVEHHTQ